MNADDLARRIVVRHREAGYLRLELPAAICHPAAAEVIDVALRQVAGCIASPCTARNAGSR